MQRLTTSSTHLHQPTPSPTGLLPAAAMALLGGMVLLGGCSTKTSSDLIQVGAIAFTDANGNQLGGTHTSINAGSTVYLDVALANDTSQLGVDWTVDCGSAPPPGTPLPPGVTQDDSCGTFTPVHTVSAPVPSYASSGSGYVTLFTAPPAPPKEGVVTIYAAATADHSRYTTVTLTVTGLPISIQFGSTPPSSLPVSGSASLRAVLTDDYNSAGVTWSVSCGAASCGSFSATQTASSVATTYTAPAAPPPSGSVAVTATSVADPTKQISAVITILPVQISSAAASSTVAVGLTDLIEATVANDVSNAGVDWGLSCGTANACGSITAHTASGIAATYTAPTTVPGTDGSVTVLATATANPAASSSIVLTIQATPSTNLRGRVFAGSLPVRHASVSIYAAGVGGYGSASDMVAPAHGEELFTDDAGRFSTSLDDICRDASRELYAVARGGNADGGENPNLVVAAPIAPCSQSASAQSIAIDEVTTVTFAYALAAFTRDTSAVGTVPSNVTGLDHAFSLARSMTDLNSGLVRQTTPDPAGIIPQEEIDTLANLLHRCAITGGGRAQDGSACGSLFALTGADQTSDTFAAALFIAQHKICGATADALYQAAGEAGPYAPSLQAPPDDWELKLRFPDSANDRPESVLNLSGTSRPFYEPGKSAYTKENKAIVDASGNVWTSDSAHRQLVEHVGAAASPLRAQTRLDE